jgi:PAS domain-containing protein
MLPESSGPDLSLEALLASLRSNEDISEKFNHDTRFDFVHDILSRSRLPRSVSFILWCLVFALFDVVLCLQVIPFPWYSALARGDFLEEPSSSNFVFLELIAQQIAVALIILIVAIVLSQWIYILTYDSKAHLAGFAATFLNVSFNHLPLILSAFSGTIFGILSVAALGDPAPRIASLVIALLLAAVYLALALNVYVFRSTIEFNLLLEESAFASFQPPFETIDLLFLFALSAFMVCRVGDYSQAVTFSCGFSMLWGGWVLGSRLNIPFVSYLPNLFFYKMPIDAFVYSLLTILALWIPIPMMVLLDLWVVLHLIDLGVAFLLLQFQSHVTCERLQPNAGHRFDPAKIVRGSQVVLALRTGISNGWTDIIDRDFLQWILSSFIEDTIIADVVRTCLLIRLPLRAIGWNQGTVAPPNVASLKFLAFQVKLYATFEMGGGDRTITGAVKTVEEEREALQQTLDGLEGPPAVGSIVDIGRAVRATVRYIRNEAHMFANAREVQDLWVSFCKDTLAAPSKIERAPRNPFERLSHPFWFILPSANRVDRRPEGMNSVEEYVRNVARAGHTAHRVLIAVGFLALSVFVISDNPNYLMQMRRVSKRFMEVSESCLLSVSLSYRLLKTVDFVTELPPISVITETLGIPSDVATEFRADFQLADPRMNDPSELLRLLEERPIIPASPNCPSLSLALISVLESRSFQSTESRRCYERTTRAYIDWLSVHADVETRNITSELEIDFGPQERALIVVSVVLLIGYASTFIRLHRRVVKLLAVVRKLRPFGDSQSAVSGLGLVEAGSVTAWCVLIVVHAIAFQQLEQQAMEASEFLLRSLFQINLVSDIARTAMTGLALVELYLGDSLYSSEYEALAAASALFALNATFVLSRTGLIPALADVPPLDHWSTTTTDNFSVLVLDFANMLIGGDFMDNGYRFLNARRYILFNISRLANSTLDGMTATALLALEAKMASFWYFSLGFMAIAIGIWLVLGFANSQRVLWFNGVEFILRREMNQSPLHRQRVLELVDSKSESILEKLPFPAIVKSDVILDCNQRAAIYLEHSIEQVRGHSLSDFFQDIRSDVLRFHTEEFAGLELVKIEDRTAEIKCLESEREFVRAIGSDLPLPFKGLVVLISVRFKTDTASIQETIAELSERFEIVAVFATPALWRGIARTCASAIGCAVCLLERFGEKAMIAIVEGLVTVAAIVGENLATAATGTCVERSDAALLHGRFGVCYVGIELTDAHAMEGPSLVILP